MSKTVIVTGAWGRVGLRTVLHLLAAGHRVIALDLPSRRARTRAATLAGRVELVWGDIRDAQLWPPLLARADSVVHMAAIIPPLVDRQPALATAVNRDATVSLVRAMAATGAAQRLVFASSMVVAGHEQHRRTPPLRVDDAPNPDSRYARTKLAGEEAIRGSGLQWTVLRLAVVVPGAVGIADMRDIDAMFEASAQGRLEVVAEDDAGLAFANAVDCAASIGRTLYIGGGAACQTTALAFYNRFLACAGVGPMRADCLRPGPPYFPGDWVDTQESQRLLRYQRRDLDAMLASLRQGIGPWRYALAPLAPLLNRLLARRSPHHQAAGNPAGAV